MIDKKKLKFYFDKEYNVLMSGKHGVGKTSAILQVFEEAGLTLGETCLYFSGSTMDPFIDFCGVPLKVEEDNQTKIKLILPEHINANKVTAIFIDEYNRCLTGDTKIQLASGKSVPIKDLVNEDYFYVYACDVENGNNPVIAKGHSARLTIKDAPLLKITLDNGQTIRCTENHPILTSDKGFVLAKDLKENDSLMCIQEENHRVVSIESDGTEDVYDISVDKYHNFALDCGVFVHNSHSKIRNSVMELIQFKSINGRKFPQLKVIWAAINPENEDDEEQIYNVDRIDPAQKDRFHVYMDIPYKCDKGYFRKMYSRLVADAALEWWNKLPPKTKDLVSPRRLDYALKIHSDGGDLSDALPPESNPSSLKLVLTIGPDGVRIQEMLNNKNVKEAKEFIRTIDGFEKFMQFIKDNPSEKSKAIEFFCQFLNDEQVSKVISDDKYSEIFNYIKSDVVNKCYLSNFSYVLSDYVKMHSTKESEELKKFLESSLGSLEEMKIEIHKSIPIGVTNETSLIMPQMRYFTTQKKYKLYCDLKTSIRREISDKGLEKIMRILNKCIGGSHLPTILKSYSDAHIYLEYVLSHVASKRLDRKKVSALFKGFDKIDASKKLEAGWTKKHEELLKKYV